MTDSAPIPEDEFAAALDALDRDGLADFVGRLWAETADEVSVDPPLITVADGVGETTILVEPGESDSALDATTVDAVVDRDAAAGADAESAATGTEQSVITPADLRNRLLYALSPGAGESIAAEFLDASARSPSYGTDAMAEGESDDEREAPTAATDLHDGSVGPAEATAALGGSGPPDSSDAAVDSGDDSPEPGRTAPDSSVEGVDAAESQTGEQATSTSDRRTHRLAVVAVTACLLLAVSGGVVYAAELSPTRDAGAFSSTTAVTPDGIAAAEIHRKSVSSSDSNGSTTATPTSDDDHPAENIATNLTETERNVGLRPTCTRSALHVVQIQMNALRYNDNETNNGIRTVRRFASPQNRKAIDTLERFIEVVKSPTYRPMLTYDSAQYKPGLTSDEYAQIQVVTREDGNVTGRYDFRLRKIEQGKYEGCWMTDGVVALSQQSDGVATESQ